MFYKKIAIIILLLSLIVVFYFVFYKDSQVQVIPPKQNNNEEVDNSQTGDTENTSLQNQNQNQQAEVPLEGEGSEIIDSDIEEKAVEIMSDEEKEKNGLPPNLNIQVIERDSEGNVTSYKVIRPVRNNDNQ